MCFVIWMSWDIKEVVLFVFHSVASSKLSHDDGEDCCCYNTEVILSETAY